MISFGFQLLVISVVLVGVISCRSEPEVDVNATVEASVAEAARAEDAASADATIEALNAQIQQQTPTMQATEPDLAATITALESRLQQVSETGAQSATGQSPQVQPTNATEQTPQTARRSADQITQRTEPRWRLDPARPRVARQ